METGPHKNDSDPLRYLILPRPQAVRDILDDMGSMSDLSLDNTTVSIILSSAAAGEGNTLYGLLVLK